VGSWSHVGDDAIVLTTGKSRHRREAIIPLYGALRDVPCAHSEARNYDPDEQPPPTVDCRRFRQLVQQGQRMNKSCKTVDKTVLLTSAKCWSGRRESNPRMQLGKLPFYH
jgi:hypothetical protein